MGYRSADSEHAIVLFDGVCNFCSHSVQFIIRRDRKGYFRFASLQSVIAGELLRDRVLSHVPDSIVLIEQNRVYTESGAVLRISRRLNGLWKVLYVLMLIPRPIRDAAYRLFAKHRYRLFGREEACMIPLPDIRARFLSIDQGKHGS
jgi:predicted DCC family thiol-disulfide oxidoreductase YuxK